MRKALSLFYLCTEIITFPLKGRLSSFIVSGKFPYRVKFYTKEMVQAARETIRRYNPNLQVFLCSGSTDCNIPLSKGIPSVCFGFYSGAGAHTRNEYLWKSSLVPGYKVCFDTVLPYFQPAP